MGPFDDDALDGMDHRTIPENFQFKNHKMRDINVAGNILAICLKNSNKTWKFFKAILEQVDICSYKLGWTINLVQMTPCCFGRTCDNVQKDLRNLVAFF